MACDDSEDHNETRVHPEPPYGPEDMPVKELKLKRKRPPVYENPESKKLRRLAKIKAFREELKKVDKKITNLTNLDKRPQVTRPQIKSWTKRNNK